MSTPGGGAARSNPPGESDAFERPFGLALSVTRQEARPRKRSRRPLVAELDVVREFRRPGLVLRDATPLLLVAPVLFGA